MTGEGVTDDVDVESSWRQRPELPLGFQLPLSPLHHRATLTCGEPMIAKIGATWWTMSFDSSSGARMCLATVCFDCDNHQQAEFQQDAMAIFRFVGFRSFLRFKILS